jgi:hypothetical protein
MIRVIVFLFSIILITSSCSTKNKIDKRKELISKFISSAAEYDTTKLYEIVDTSSYFRIQSKEGFLFQVGYINSRFKECGATFIDSAIKIREVPVNSKEYIIPFCRGKNNEVINDSFDLLFTFTDYDDDEKIHYIDINKYRGNVRPTISPPNQ